MEKQVFGIKYTIFKNFVYLSVLSILVGCSTGSALITGEKQEPIDPNVVEVYRNPPQEKFEYIGIVQSESVEILSEQEALDRALEELKKQAAKIGANGVILISAGERQDSFTGYSPSSFGENYFYSGTDEYQTLKGDAISVEVKN